MSKKGADLFEDDIPSDVELSVQLSCDNRFIEEVKFDAEHYYDISSTFKLGSHNAEDSQQSIN